MLLALLQARAQVLDAEANLAAIENAAERAAAAGAAVLLTPELFVVGYAPRRLRSELDPESLPALHDRLARIAARHSVAIVYSLPEVRGEDWMITATFVDAAGAVQGRYVKVHLFGDGERSVFSPGNSPATVLEYRGLKLGMVICFDVEFPEAVRAAALQGVQLLLVPTALGSGYESVSTTLVPARALENQMYVAYANHTGVEDGFELGGVSVVADPFGRLAARGDREEQLLFADIEPSVLEKARAEIPYLAERRTDLYRNWGL